VHSRAANSTRTSVEPTSESPRCLNLHQAADYLGVSYWTLRDYTLQGLIPVVHLPGLRAREGDRQRASLRRVVIDRRDLDAFLDSLKGIGEGREVVAIDTQSRSSGVDPTAEGISTSPRARQVRR
jgi:hypothetical protein